MTTNTIRNETMHERLVKICFVDNEKTSTTATTAMHKNMLDIFIGLLMDKRANHQVI